MRLIFLIIRTYLSDPLLWAIFYNINIIVTLVLETLCLLAKVYANLLRRL